MPLTPDNIKALEGHRAFAKEEASKCNIAGTLFAFGELVKKGQGMLEGKHPADTFAKIKHVYDGTTDDIITAFKTTCGCKGVFDSKK